MFVSTSDGDGKTMLSLSLATVAKAHGLKTVVVDLNPLSKGPAKLSGVPLADSPVDQLLNGDAEIGDIVATSPIYPFLDLIVAQRTPHDSNQFFRTLREHYDLIVVDAMSAEESDDAIWLSSYVDSVFVVISADRTKRRHLTELMQRLDFSQSLLVGGIVNFFGKPKNRMLPSRKNPFQITTPRPKSLTVT
jgi:Mrp family chromosome partitioning ATPase